MPNRLLRAATLAAPLLMSCASVRADDAAGKPLAPMERVAALSALGAKLFREPALSASGRQSCASCHDPSAAFTPANDAPVQLGGPDMQRPGTRAVPTLKYLQGVPFFTEHYYSEDEGDESIDNGPTGGLTWDGRVGRGRDQARIPLLSANEMANTDIAGVARRALDAGYGPSIARIAGAPALATSDSVVATLTEALETYQQEPDIFYPYSSKFDAYLDGQATLTAPERRGMEAYGDPARGNCAHCHHDNRPQSGAHPTLTDFGILAVAVPRNPAIAANADPAHFDLGLCGPDRTDLRDRPEYCGMFKTPTLRNVALKRSYFHNGVVHSLRDAVAFYAERDLKPEKWYARGPDGAVMLYDDLPQRYRGNIDREPPFDRAPGDKPALSEQEIDDIVAFLGTFTDGFRKPMGSAAR